MAGETDLRFVGSVEGLDTVAVNVFDGADPAPIRLSIVADGELHLCTAWLTSEDASEVAGLLIEAIAQAVET